MQKWWRFINGILTLLLSGLGCYAQIQGQHLAFESIGVQKGLSHHIVYCLLQDRRGFIWAGTEYGLNRYNGLNCTSYFTNSHNRPSLSDNHINRLAEDVDGQIWAGTNHGISRLNPLTGQWTQFFNTEEERAEIKDLGLYVFSDRKGQLWAANGYFVFQYNHNTQKFNRYPIDCGQSSGNTRNYFVLDFLQDRKGRYWLATSYGVKRFDSVNGVIKSYHFPEKNTRLEANSVTSLAEAPDGRLMAGTWGGGILVYNPENDQFEQLDVLPKGTVTQNGLKIVLDIAFAAQTLYLGTSGGLLKGEYPFCLNNNLPDRWQLITKKINDNRGLPGDVVYNILVDKTENLWLATNNNIAHTTLRFSAFDNRSIAYNDESPIIPTSVAVNRTDTTYHSYWLGASGLFLVNQAKNTIEKIPLAGMPNKNMGQETVWDMVQGKTALWLATNNGVLAFDEKKKKVKTIYLERTTVKTGIAGNRIGKLFEDSRGNIWAGTIRMGISIINPFTSKIKNYFTDKTEKNTLFNKTTTKFFESQNGDVWFGADERLYHYLRDKDTFCIYPFSVTSKNGQVISGKPIPFFEDANGKLWVAFNDGIAAVDIKTKKMEPLLVKAIYFKPEGNLVSLKNGTIWIGTNNGLFRLDTATMKLTRFTTNDGLISNETDGCLTAMPDGSLITGSMGYLTRFQPDALSEREPPPPVTIARIQVNGKDTSTYFSQKPIWKYQSTLLFEFSALSFNNASQNQYQYRLVGADENWNPVTYNYTVTYAQLPAGNYTFLVKGSNSDGVWNPEPVAFSFKIEAPFYLKGWFIFLIVLLFAGMAIAFYRERLSQALRVERLRTKLATDLHDDVGATLSAISMYSDALKKQVEKPQLVTLLEKMGEDSREMVRTMSDLVWAINPKNDGGDKLLQRMENYATDLCASKEITLQFESDPKTSAHTIGIETRRNIYLIFKEAITNALKYAGCSHLYVKIGIDGKQFLLMIKDNGKGFDTPTNFTGNGLKNMQTRAAEINGKLTIDTSPGNGCSIQLICPI